MQTESHAHQAQEETTRQIWKAHMKDFTSRLFESATEEERLEFDRTAGEEPFIEDAIAFALKQPERYKKELTDLIGHLQLATGKRLFDPVHTGGLAVDREGNIVVIRSQEFDVDIDDGTSEKGDSTYEVLTGSDKGKTYSTRTHPLRSSRPSTQTIGEA